MVGGVDDIDVRTLSWFTSLDDKMLGLIQLLIKKTKWLEMVETEV